PPLRSPTASSRPPPHTPRGPLPDWIDRFEVRRRIFPSPVGPRASTLPDIHRSTRLGRPRLARPSPAPVVFRLARMVPEARSALTRLFRQETFTFARSPPRPLRAPRGFPTLHHPCRDCS